MHTLLLVEKKKFKRDAPDTMIKLVNITFALIIIDIQNRLQICFSFENYYLSQFDSVQFSFINLLLY